MLNAALEYLKQGLSVIPVGKDKKPLVSWKLYQTIPATEDKVRAWFTQWPDANIGIVTGEVVGLTMVDCDDRAAIDYMMTVVPDTVPRFSSGRGGQYVFKHDGEHNTVKVDGMEIDVRGEGGYSVVPPSIHANGKVYKWKVPFKRENLICIPNELKERINKDIKYGYKANDTSSGEKVPEGQRNEGLFKFCCSLRAKGMSDETILKSAELFVQNEIENPENFTDWQETVKSALRYQPGEKVSNRYREGISEVSGGIKSIKPIVEGEVRDYVLGLDGDFYTRDVKDYFNAREHADKKYVDCCINRMKKDGKIKPVGSRSGCYRVVQALDGEMDLEGSNSDPIVLRWPLNMQELITLYPKNLVVVAGSSNAGKTAFLLNMVRENPHIQWRYINSEMGVEEFRLRLKLFKDAEFKHDWKNLKAYERSSDFEDYVDPEGYTIIDFIEAPEEAWKVKTILTKIHQKLTTGICIACMQKTSKKEFAVGGEGTLEKARLYVTLDYQKATIMKAKSWKKMDVNPNKMYCEFKLWHGCKFTGKWFTAEGEPFDMWAKKEEYFVPEEEAC